MGAERRMAIVAELGRVAALARSATPVAAEVVERVHAELEVGAAVFVRAPGGGLATLASAGWSTDGPSEGSADPIGHALDVSEVVTVEDPSDERFSQCGWLRQTRGLLAVPMEAPGGALGVLAVAAPLTDERTFLQAVANLLGSALGSRDAIDRAIVEHSSDGIFVADPHGIYVDVNPAGCALVGYERDELIGLHLVDLLPEGAPALRYDELRLRGRMHTLRELLRKDGTRVSVDLGAALLPDGSLLGFARDATARLETEAALRKASDRLHQALRASGAGAWEWEVGSHGAYWSEENFELMGLKPEAGPVSYERWRDAVHPDDRAAAEESIVRAISEQRDLDIEFRVVLPGGRIRWLRDVGKMAFDERGEPQAMYGIQIDVTEHRAAEERARVSERLESMGRLAGGVAHDFNNLLTVIVSLTELVSRELPDDHVVQRDLSEMQDAATRGASLTQQMLAFGRRQRLRPQRVDVASRILGLAPMLRRLIGEDIRIDIDIDDDLAPVEADPGQLDQVVLNLVLNARDAMRGGGSIHVGAASRNLDGRDATVLGVPPGRYTVLSVTDTGAGMDERTRAQIFEPFFTTKELGRGTGLGLATVYGVVRQSGGVIQVESEPGAGARFDVLLPAVDAPSVERLPVSDRAYEPTTGTLLLVEDDDVLRRISARVLATEGHHVLAAADGDEALALVEAYTGRVDLLVTDVVLGGMNGRELWDRLCEVQGPTPVLLVSGYVLDDLQRRGIGADLPLLPKPFTAAELVEAVARAMTD